MANFREKSKENFTAANDLDHINAGSLQRIADATEVMAKNYLAMQSDLEWYKKQYRSQLERSGKLERSNASLRGHIKRIKNKQCLTTK